MVEQTTPYGIATTIPLPYEAAIERTREALAAEGFGVLSQIDIATTLKNKLDVDFRPYTILGACNPPLAHRALQVEDKIGTIIPLYVTTFVLVMNQARYDGMAEVSGEVTVELQLYFIMARGPAQTP